MTPDTKPLEAIAQACQRIIHRVGENTLQHGLISAELHDIQAAATELDQQCEHLARDLLEAQADAGWTTDNDDPEGPN